ncbi:hypothetical protein Pr1d_46090 [Bythopirellula goksoeyrii]|uniref:Uncharacterized protein n=1 Tax=Bythopirellula goksoeyrii TaxID=1400387 RepID=A0A5B9QE49_9BACT|nr:hypothetical protein Pr1d_46090 [Bythopirellula goksoeyrii]
MRDESGGMLHLTPLGAEVISLTRHAVQAVRSLDNKVLSQHDDSHDPSPL